LENSVGNVIGSGLKPRGLITFKSSFKPSKPAQPRIHEHKG